MILSTNMITNIPSPDLTSFFAICSVIFFTDQRKKDGSDFEPNKMFAKVCRLSVDILKCKICIYIYSHKMSSFILNGATDFYGLKTRLSLKAQSLANQPTMFRRENCARKAPTKLIILKKFLRSQNGRRCKKMQKDFVQVRNVFQLPTQRM